MKFIALIAAALLVLLAACAGDGEDSQPSVRTPSGNETPLPSPQPEKHTLQGAVHLGAASVAFGVMAKDIEGSYCEGVRGATDIRRGSEIAVKDESGTVIGLARLKLGQLRLLGEDKNIGDCFLGFDVHDLPASEFYTIAAGNRPPATYSYDELQTKGWKIDLIFEVEPLDIDILD